MKYIITIFIKAILLYLIITLPSIYFPPLYFFSAIFALCVCWIAGIVFGIGFWQISRMKANYREKMILLQLFALLGVLTAFASIETFGLWHNIWSLNFYLLFPAAAWLAAAISIFLSKTSLKEHFNLTNNNHELLPENKM